MQTFERCVYYVLVRIAYENHDFLDLSEAHVRDALARVGYLEIEPGFKRVPA